jgi:hypothetical protein
MSDDPSLTRPPETQALFRALPLRWTVLLYVWLAIITGAVSFQSRKEKVAVAAAWQQRAWEAVASRGRVFEGDGGYVTADFNLLVFSRRPLFPAVHALIVKCTGLSWPYAFAGLRLLLIAACYVAFDAYLRRWLAPPLPILGTLLLAATIPLTFKDWWEVPTDFPEILFLTLGLGFIAGRRYAPLVAITAIATLNRPTSVYFPVLLLLSCRNFHEVRQKARPLLACTATVVAVSILNRVWMSFLPTHDMLAHFTGSFAHAITGLQAAWHPYNNFLYYGYLFGPLWVVPFLRSATLPHLLRRALFITPFHVMMALIGGGGRIDEPRQIVMLYPILVPAALAAIFPAAVHSAAEDAGTPATNSP